jgi:14-3-3 protein epsilon
MAKTYSREEYVFLAKLYEKAERFDDMVKWINKFVELDPVLSQDERNLLSAGYKNIISGKRAAYRLLNQLERKEGKKNPKNVTYLKEIKKNLEKEMSDIGDLINNLLKNYLVPNAKDYETKVFYLKLKGDYERYKCEYSQEDDFEKACKQAEDSYNEAYRIAEKHLNISNSIRLGLALNFAVFYYEIMNKREEACEIAKNAFEEAIKILDDLEKNKARDTILIIQLLKENMILWNNEMQEEEEN